MRLESKRYSVATITGIKWEMKGVKLKENPRRNAGGVYKDLEVVVTTAIGCQIPYPESDLKDEHGMRVVKVTKKEITHSFHPLHSFPTRIEI